MGSSSATSPAFSAQDYEARQRHALGRGLTDPRTEGQQRQERADGEADGVDSPLAAAHELASRLEDDIREAQPHMTELAVGLAVAVATGEAPRAHQFALRAGWPAIGIVGAALAALLNGLGEEIGPASRPGYRRSSSAAKRTVAMLGHGNAPRGEAL